MLLLVWISSSTACKSSSSNLPSNDGIRDFASSTVSGHKFAIAASSNLWSFNCFNKLERSYKCSMQIKESIESSLSDGGNRFLILKLSEPVCISQCFHEDIWEFLLVFRGLVLSFPVFQQHVYFWDEKRFSVLKFCKKK